MAAYTYSPLSATLAQIRLFRFFPQRTDRSLKLEIEAFELESAPAYRAVSYLWGAPGDSEDILLNGLKFVVGRSCHYALKQAQRQDYDSWLWMDGICIDQTNLQEKTQQVRIMGDIFKRAEAVYACVGAHEDSSDLLFSIAGDSHTEVHITPVDLIEGLKSHLAKVQSPLDTLLSAVNHFGQREYWSRLWIAQELQLARDLYICCEHDCISFEELWKYLGPCLDFIKKKRRSRTRLPLYAHGQARNCRHAESGNLPWIMQPVSILNKCYWLRCTDIRDRIYGTLGMISWPKDLPPIDPDYQISSHELAMRFMPYIEAEPSGEAAPYSASVDLLIRAFDLGSIDTGPQRCDSGFDGMLSPEHDGRRAFQFSAAARKLQSPVVGSGLSIHSQHHGAIRKIDKTLLINSAGLMPIKIGGDLIGYACPGAETGDYLLQLGPGGPNKQFYQWLVARRETRSDRCQLIGKAWMIQAFTLTPRSDTRTKRRSSLHEMDTSKEVNTTVAFLDMDILTLGSELWKAWRDGISSLPVDLAFCHTAVTSSPQLTSHKVECLNKPSFTRRMSV